MNITQFNGVAYPSLKAAARAAGIGYQTVTGRIKVLKWTIEKALSEPAFTATLHTANGFTGMISEHAARAGMNDASLIKRMQRGESLEQAISYPPRPTYSVEQRREVHKAEKKRRDDFNRTYVMSVKSGPCTDCRNKFHPHAMEFDHCRGIKSFDISRSPGKSLTRIKAEIAKCDLVCANCHRIRTASRTAGSAAQPTKPAQSP